MERRITLFMCLGVPEPASGMGALFWHNLLVQGLPYRSLEVLARYLRVKPHVLAGFIGMSKDEMAAARRQRVVPLAYSAQLFSIARLYRQALDAVRDEVKAAEWMGTPRPELRNRQPVDLARTPLGAEMATTLLQRMRPQPQGSDEEDPATDEAADEESAERRRD
jgi:putative toxin-antitoxin system antitoxin component (TIGR02293 family)